MYTKPPKIESLAPTTPPAAQTIDTGWPTADRIVTPWYIAITVHAHELTQTESIILQLTTPHSILYAVPLTAPGDHTAPLYIATGAAIPDPYRRTGPYILAALPNLPIQAPTAVRILGTEFSLFISAKVETSHWLVHH